MSVDSGSMYGALKASASLIGFPDLNKKQLQESLNLAPNDPYILEHMTPAKYMALITYKYLLDPSSKNKNDFNTELDNFNTIILPEGIDDILRAEGKQAAIQEDFAYCFMQVSKAARGRQMLLEDDRVVEYLCDIAVEGLTENATQYAKDALATLKPTTMAEKRVWCISFDEVARTGKWPIVQTPRSNLRTGTEQPQPQRQNPHHEWAGSGQKYAAIIAAETKAEIDAAGGIPEGDPPTADAASPAQASPAKSDVSAAPAVPRPVVKPGRVTADLLEEAARKTKVRKGLWGKVSGGGPDGGGVTAVRKNLLLNVQSKLTEKELARVQQELEEVKRQRDALLLQR